MNRAARISHYWAPVGLIAALAVLLPLKHAIWAFRDEYAAFRVSNHVVKRPPAVPGLPAMIDLQVRVPGGQTLAAWYLPSRNRAAIVLVHGSQGDRASLWTEAQILARAGFGVMLFDMPGHGESAGSVDWGRGGRAALSAAVTSLLTQPGVDPDRVGAMGFSMGAMLVSQVAAADERIRAVLLSGCFSDARQQTLFQFRRWGPITGWPAIWAYRAAGFDDRDQRPVDVIRRVAPRPLLIVHGVEDDVVPAEMAAELHAAAGSHAELWLVHDAGHGDFLQAAPELWPRRLRAFFEQALLPAT